MNDASSTSASMNRCSCLALALSLQSHLPLKCYSHLPVSLLCSHGLLLWTGDSQEGIGKWSNDRFLSSLCSSLLCTLPTCLRSLALHFLGLDFSLVSLSAVSSTLHRFSLKKCYQAV